MQILILRNTVASGSVVRAGQVISTDEKEAQILIRMGKAEEFKPPQKQPLEDRQVKAKELFQREESKPAEEIKPRKKAGRPKKSSD